VRRRSREGREDKVKAPKTPKAPKTSKRKEAAVYAEPEFVTRGGHEFALLDWGLELD
jgi:hypothetical protein